MIQPADMPHSFPLVRAGGLFIVVMGLGVGLGGIFPAQRRVLLALGTGAAILATVLAARALSQPLGVPSRQQIWALAGAVALEGLLMTIVVVRLRGAGERALLLAILLVVGIHFLPMALAFGPLCAMLGAAVVANASLGLWAWRDAPLRLLWLMDGTIKVVFGALMLSAGRYASIA